MKKKKTAWQSFTHWFTIIFGSLTILFLLFCFLTQWKGITVSTEGISVKEVYQAPNGTIIYRLNVPEDTYASCWEWELKDDGSGYQIPKRSIIELERYTQVNQLDVYLCHDRNEMNSAQLKTGGPAITSWYIGAPIEAVFIWNEEMEVEPAPDDVLRKVGLLGPTQEELDLALSNLS